MGGIDIIGESGFFIHRSLKDAGARGTPEAEDWPLAAFTERILADRREHPAGSPAVGAEHATPLGFYNLRYEAMRRGKNVLAMPHGAENPLIAGGDPRTSLFAWARGDFLIVVAPAAVMAWARPGSGMPLQPALSDGSALSCEVLEVQPVSPGFVALLGAIIHPWDHEAPAASEALERRGVIPRSVLFADGTRIVGTRLFHAPGMGGLLQTFLVVPASTSRTSIAVIEAGLEEKDRIAGTWRRSLVAEPRAPIEADGALLIHQTEWVRYPLEGRLRFLIWVEEQSARLARRVAVITSDIPHDGFALTIGAPK